MIVTQDTLDVNFQSIADSALIIYEQNTLAGSRFFFHSQEQC